MAGYRSLFSGQSGAATTTEKTGKQGYTSIFGGATVQQASDDEIKQRNQQQAADSAKRTQDKARADAQAAKDKANNSILGKVKTAAKAAVTDVVHTGEKALNTTAAGTGGIIGATTAAVQSATGHKDAARKTVISTNKGVDALLDHGLGNQGGYISSKDAATSNPKAVIKGIAKGTADIAPLVIPAGKAVEGGSILARAATKLDPALETVLRSEKFLPGAARAAVGNAAVGAGTDATNQLIDSGHVNLKQTGQAALEGGVFGAAMHGVTHAGTSLFSKVRQNTLPEHVAQAHIDANGPDVPPATPGLPRPGEVIAPQPATARAEMLQEKPAIVPSTPSVPLAHNGAIQPQPTLPFDRPVEGQLPIDAEATAAAGKPTAAAEALPRPEPEAKPVVPSEQGTPKAAPVETAKAEPKQEPINGFHSSDEMRQGHAQMLRDYDKQATGGNKYHVHQSGAPDVGEKSPFFKQFFKENGKRPTKADYDAEAHKQLLQGEDKQTYTKLLEREGKISPETKDPPVTKEAAITAYHGSTDESLTSLKPGAKTGLNEKRNLIYLAEDKKTAGTYTKTRGTDGNGLGELSDSKTGKVYDVKVTGKVLGAYDFNELEKLKTADGFNELSGKTKNQLTNPTGLSADILESNPELTAFLSDNGVTAVRAHLINGGGNELIVINHKNIELAKTDSPAPKPAESVSPSVQKEPSVSEKPVSDTPAGEGTDKGISRTAASVQQKALEKGLEKDYGQLAEYDKTTIKRQAAQATELLNGPRDDIEAILAGEKPLPDGLKASTFIKAIEEHPEYGHDPDMLRDLGRSDIHKQISTAAQELRLSRERNPNSSVEAIRQIDQIRKDSFKQKYGKTAERAQAEEVKAIQAAQPKLESNDWNDFIDSIKCPT